MELAFDRHRSVLADKPDKPALNANLVRAEDAGLVRGVCGLRGEGEVVVA